MGHRRKSRPLLHEACGGATSLVWVGVVLEPLDLAVRPCGEVRHPLLDATTAADQAAALPKDAEHDAVPEIEELLLLVAVVLPAATPVPHEAPDRLCALEGLQPSRGHVIDRVVGEHAHHPVKVTATHGLIPLSRKPHQVDDRGPHIWAGRAALSVFGPAFHLAALALQPAPECD